MNFPPKNAAWLNILWVETEMNTGVSVPPAIHGARRSKNVCGFGRSPAERCPATHRADWKRVMAWILCAELIRRRCARRCIWLATGVCNTQNAAFKTAYVSREKIRSLQRARPVSRSVSMPTTTTTANYLNAKVIVIFDTNLWKHSR